MKINKNKYLKYLNPIELSQTKKVLKANPSVSIVEQAETNNITQTHLYLYNSDHCEQEQNTQTTIDLTQLKENQNYWWNIPIQDKNFVEEIGKSIGLHPLAVEDILSKHQRAKAEDFDNIYLCILQTLNFNKEIQIIESSQISFVLGKNYLFTFQEDNNLSLFNPICKRLESSLSKIRTRSVDYLMYAMLDTIVDNYFEILEEIGEQIEKLEEEITRNQTNIYTMNKINTLRKELIFFKRHTAPVRELVNNIIRSDSPYIDDKYNNYFKDIYDHIIQIIDLTENYRDVVSNIRDLYLNQNNLKLNEVMKILTIVTTLLAPATVIGGVFGMNFDKIPFAHHQYGFWITTVIMLIIPLLMLVYFKKKKWF